MEGILAEAGNIDILINNAGIMYLGITEAFSVNKQNFSRWKQTISEPSEPCKAFAIYAQGRFSGLIINTSSLVGRMSPPFFSTYTATKHALEGYVHKHCGTKYHLLVLMLSW
jgi:short-subunit dehydrogenase